MASGMLGRPVAAYRRRREPSHAGLIELFSGSQSRRSQGGRVVLSVDRLSALLELP
jgi:hypothetical protein